VLARAAGAGIDGPAGHALLDRLVQQQAGVMALTDYFRVAAVIVLCVLPLVWLAHRQKAGVALGGGH